MITNFFITSFLKTMSGQSGLIAVMASFLLYFDRGSSYMLNSLAGLSGEDDQESLGSRLCCCFMRNSS